MIRHYTDKKIAKTLKAFTEVQQLRFRAPHRNLRKEAVLRSVVPRRKKAHDDMPLRERVTRLLRQKVIRHTIDKPSERYLAGHAAFLVY